MKYCFITFNEIQLSTFQFPGVAYDIVSNKIYNHYNWTIEAQANARNYQSEAWTSKQYLTNELHISADHILVEEDSFSTIENALFGSEYFNRLAETNFNNTAKLTVGIVTNLYHMKRALSDFRQYASRHNFEPFFAEGNSS